MAARLHPGLIRPGVVVQSPYDGRRARRRLGEERVRIGLLLHLARESAHRILVVRPRAQHWDKQFPHAAIAPLHRMVGAVPLIEVADDADIVGVGRPHCEANAASVAFAHQVRAQHAITLVMRALGMQMQLEGCQGSGDGGCLHIAIMALDAAASRIAPAPGWVGRAGNAARDRSLAYARRDRGQHVIFRFRRISEELRVGEQAPAHSGRLRARGPPPVRAPGERRRHLRGSDSLGRRRAVEGAESPGDL